MPPAGLSTLIIVNKKSPTKIRRGFFRMRFYPGCYLALVPVLLDLVTVFLAGTFFTSFLSVFLSDFLSSFFTVFAGVWVGCRIPANAIPVQSRTTAKSILAFFMTYMCCNY